MTKLTTKKQDARHYIMVLIGLIICAIFWLAPPFGQMTHGGMKVLGIFIAVIFLWTADEVAWSSVFGIVMIAFTVKDLYPDYTSAGIYQSISLSMGTWLITFIVACLLMAYAVTETGVVKRIASWFLRRPFARKSAWHFTFMFLVSALVIGCFMDPTVTLVFYLGFAYSIFEMLGYKKGDSYPSMLITALCFTLMISYVMTPISHASILTGMGLITSLTGVSIDFLSFMIVGVPIGIVCFIGTYFIFKKLYHADVSKFDGADFDALVGERTPMSKREIWASAIFGVVVAEWLLSGLVNIVAPNSALNTTLSGLTAVIPVMVGTIVMMVVRVEGRPLLDFNEGMKKGVPWNVIILLACVFAIGTVLTLGTAGFTATIGDWLAPVMNSGISIVLVMAIMCALMVVATNFLNNIPIMMLALNVLIPLALGMGISGGAAGMAILISVNLAFATPASFANNAIVFADEWAVKSKCYQFGFIIMFWCMIVCAVLAFPWAHLILG
jgi:sodium-dependent dicarboxylate transporter 2/3/5